MAKKPTATTKKKTTKAATKTTTRKTAAPRASSKDAESNKGMAIIAYIGILCLIPLLTGDYKKSSFLKFHTNQGVVLFITAIATWIASWILWAIFAAMRLWFIGGFLSPLVGITIFVFMILGIINAVNGVMKPLPLIGKFTIIK